MVLSYADFGKVARKLLGDDYVYGKKVEVKTSTANAVDFTATGLENPNDGSLSGTLSWKYKLYGNSFTTKVLSSSALSTEAVFDKLGVDGFKATVNSTLGAGRHSAFAKLEYLNDPVAASTVVDVTGQSATSSLAVGQNNFSVGANATYVNDVKAVTDYSVAATYLEKDSEFTAAADNKLQAFKLYFSHTVTPTFAVAAEALYSPSKSAVGMVAGVRYDARDATFKAKADNTGIVSLSYLTKLNPGATITVSTTANAKELEKGQSIGLALTIDKP